MRPLSHDEVMLVSGGDSFDDYVHNTNVAIFLWELSVVGSRGSSSEQPTPPYWWGDPNEQKWIDYCRVHLPYYLEYYGIEP